MNLFKADIQDKKLQLKVIEAYTEVFGKQYESIIARRILSATYIPYTTTHGVRDYIFYAKKWKSKELGLRFLKEIGYDVEEEQAESLALPYHAETRELVKQYLGASFVGLGFNYDEEDSVSGIKAFDEARLDNPRYKREEIEDWMRSSQVHLLNFLRGNDELDFFNLDEFCKTEEYSKWKEQIQSYIEIYNRLRQEYKDFDATFAELTEYVKAEDRRLDEVAIKFDRDWPEHGDKIFEAYLWGTEEFQENLEKLRSKEDIEKMVVVYLSRSVCVQEQMASKNAMLFLTIRDGEDISRLDYILLHEMCHVIGTEISDELEPELPEGTLKVEGIREDLLSKRKVRSGFDSITNLEANPNNPERRKYEVLNETITDLFAIEARERLHEQGVYLLEEQEFSIENVEDANTGKDVKRLVKPLVQDFREEVIEAVILGNREPLMRAIGEENFEELNDAVNVVYAIVTGKVVEVEKPEEAKQKIREQAIRCKKTYERIAERRRNHSSKEKDEEER